MKAKFKIGDNVVIVDETHSWDCVIKGDKAVVTYVEERPNEVFYSVDVFRNGVEIFHHWNGFEKCFQPLSSAKEEQDMGEDKKAALVEPKTLDVEGLRRILRQAGVDQNTKLVIRYGAEDEFLLKKITFEERPDHLIMVLS